MINHQIKQIIAIVNGKYNIFVLTIKLQRPPEQMDLEYLQFSFTKHKNTTKNVLYSRKTLNILIFHTNCLIN